MRLDHGAIRALLPHRFPMLLLDRVDHVVPGERLHATKAITATEPCYRDLPDGIPPSAYAYPVPLIIESLAQAAGLLWLLSPTSPDPDHLLMLTSLRNVRIESRVYPGDVLRLEAIVGHIGKDAAHGRGEIWSGNRRIATMGSFLAVSRPCVEILARC
jgi:3-hydroxyacyl-[acyl-carrier-protein] dehydratase